MGKNTVTLQSRDFDVWTRMSRCKKKNQKRHLSWRTLFTQSPDTNINDRDLLLHVQVPQQEAEVRGCQWPPPAGCERAEHMEKLSHWRAGTGDQDTRPKVIVKAKGLNNFKLPHAKDLEDFDWETLCEQWEDEQSEERVRGERVRGGEQRGGEWVRGGSLLPYLAHSG